MEYKEIEEQYVIGKVLQIIPTLHGSGNTYQVVSDSGTYIAKRNERLDFVEIYHAVQQHLSRHGLLASRIINTAEGTLVTADHMALYQWIPGITYSKLSAIQVHSAVSYMGRMNHILKEYPFERHSIKSANHWDKAKSLNYIIEGFMNEYGAFLPGGFRDILDQAIHLLAENKHIIMEADKQLIHSDLGPDNFLFDGPAVSAVIDFTPEYANELYALCHFVYWTNLWQEEHLTTDQINQILTLYRPDDGSKVKLFAVLLLQCCLFRIIGPLIDRIQKSDMDFTPVTKRLNLVSLVAKLNTVSFLSL